MSDLRLRAFVEAERDRIVTALFDWLRIPSISAHPDHAGDVRRSADFCAGLMRDAGLEHVEVLETPSADSTDGGAPAVYGDWLHAGADAPTILVYGHHDVQPVDPLELWDSPPFEPVIVDGEPAGSEGKAECKARGAIDDKGQVLYEIEAVRGLLQRDGSLPVNLKFIVEGEEEVGSPNFEALLTAHRERLACDAVVVSDTGMWAEDIPSICVAMRGLVAFDVKVTTGLSDLHSGMFGGAVPNPTHRVARLVEALHDDDGRVAVPGFYDRVLPLSEAEERSMRDLPFDEDAWRRLAGVETLEGESGASTLERIGSRPTCDVVGLYGGYGGEGIKTIVPAWAACKVTFRLVPDQRPEEVEAAFRSFAESVVGEGATVTVTSFGGVAPLLSPVDHPLMGALVRAIERVWGTPPLFTREGGSGPEEALARVLDAPVLFLGVGLPGDRIHAPNERMVMDQFWKGLLAAGELWHEMAGGARG